jgi:hypothetical protein
MGMVACQPTQLGRGLVTLQPTVLDRQILVSVPLENSLVVSDNPLGSISVFGDRWQRAWQRAHGGEWGSACTPWMLTLRVA